MFCWFLVFPIKTVKAKTYEYKYCSKPLPGSHWMLKYYNRTKNGEKLASRCYDGTGQRTKVCHRHKDENLQKPKTQSNKL